MATAAKSGSFLRSLMGEDENQFEHRASLRVVLQQHWPMYVMLIPAFILMGLFSYYPLYGIVLAFKDFSAKLGVWGSPWVGWLNFRTFFASRNAVGIMRNTVFISISKIVVTQTVAVLFALFLNDIKRQGFKRAVQTGTTLTHFLSWVIIGGVMLQILGSKGALNLIINAFGGKSIRFLGKAAVFPWTLILSHVWKEFGWGAVIYLAALTSVNPELYEAAAVDGAGRFKRMFSISLPSIKPIIILMACLSLGGILSAGFEQVLMLYNPLVYDTGDILDTYVYRIGLLGGNGAPDYSLGTAVGLLKSVVGFFLVMLSYWSAGKFANYRVF